MLLGETQKRIIEILEHERECGNELTISDICNPYDHLSYDSVVASIHRLVKRGLLCVNKTERAYKYSLK